MNSSLIRPGPGEFLAGQKNDGLLHFYGMVKEKDAAAVEGAVVMVFACFAGGIEKALGSAITGREGAYFISIPKLANDSELLGFKVRAGKAYILPEGVDSPDHLEHLHPNKGWGSEQEKIPEKEATSEQEKTLDWNSILKQEKNPELERIPEQEEILDLKPISAQQAIPDEIAGPLTGYHTEDPAHKGESDESKNKDPDIEKAKDEYPDRREEKGLTVLLSRMDLNSLPVIVVPVAQTDAATNISTNSVTLNGSIGNTGGENCDQRKFRIRLQDSESWTDAGIETGSFGPGSFSFNLTGLNPGATYEFKAMAHNQAGWGEGEVKTFTAEAFAEAPAKSTATGRSRGKPTRDESKGTPYDAYRSAYWRNNNEAKSTGEFTRPKERVTGVPADSKDRKAGGSQNNLSRNTAPGSNSYKAYQSAYWDWSRR
ncbi:MAG: fibronectin type III domain-containing protein [Firmicutes bacterium]|nr:fibronectin type III domain-containing protein [Bacillota bacterium]